MRGLPRRSSGQSWRAQLATAGTAPDATGGARETEIVCRRTGRTFRIGDRLDSAGRGAIYAVEPASSDLVLKQYRAETLQKRPELEARIKAMIADPPAYRSSRSDYVSCAWPVDAAYISGRFVGFLMPRVRPASDLPAGRRCQG
jgi:DNA-binding helix-hairpin-helix protein with protein kinase domain